MVPIGACYCVVKSTYPLEKHSAEGNCVTRSITRLENAALTVCAKVADSDAKHLMRDPCQFQAGTHADNQQRSAGPNSTRLAFGYPIAIPLALPARRCVPCLALTAVTVLNVAFAPFSPFFSDLPG